MTSVSVTVDISAALKKLDLAAKQVPFAAALALTKTAQAAQGAVVAGMRSAFQTPSAFVLRSVRIRGATKANLVAEVYIAGSAANKGAGKALSAEVFGGQRDPALEVLLKHAGMPPSAYPWATPGSGAKLNAAGGISLPWLRTVLASLGAGKYGPPVRRRRGPPVQTFVLVTPHKGLSPGIYRKRGHHIVALIHFSAKRPTYGKRLDFFGIAERTARERFAIEFERAAQQAMSTAR